MATGPTTGKVLIAGGGIGGLTAALCLARVGFRAAVFEQTARFEELGAGLQISPNGARVLHHLGLAAALDACAFLPLGTEIRSWRSGKVVSASPLGDSVRSIYGYPYYHIHRGDLLHVLVEAASRNNHIELNTGCTVQRFEQDDDGVGMSVLGEAGETHHRGKILIGADGIHSTVRAGLFGPEAPTFTGNVAWRALVPTQRLPRGLIQPVTTLWWGPGRHFVHYYVRGGTLVNCVGVVEKAGWEVESWTAHGDCGAVQALRADFAGWHPNIQTLIDHMDWRSLYEWALYDRLPAAHWGIGSVTLLGDACHPMLPFMAQGAATSIEDAAVLARCLGGGQPVASSLRRYEALRRPRTTFIQRQARRNAKLFHLSGSAAWLRDRTAKWASGRVLDRLFRYDALTAA